MKKILIPMGFLMLTVTAFSQAEGSVNPQLKSAATKLTAAKIELPYSPQVVTDALDNFIRKHGITGMQTAKYKQSADKGFMMYLRDLSKLHFYVKLKKITDPNVTELYLDLTSTNLETDDENAIQVFTLEEATVYLNNLAVAIKPYAQEQQQKLLSTQLLNCKEKTVSLEREAASLQAEVKRFRAIQQGQSYSHKKAHFTGKIEAINKKIEKNKMALDKQNYETAKQEEAMAALLSKTKE